MSDEAVFRAAVLGLLVAIWAVRVAYGWRHRQVGRRFRPDRDAVAREGQWSFVMRVALFFVFMGAILAYAAGPEWLGRFAVRLPPWLRWVGGGFALASLALLVWVHHTLGRYWSVNLELAGDHALVTAGPYARVSHPMYSALFGFLAGLSLLAASGLIALPSAAAIIILARRMPREEAMMAGRFGDEYRRYRERTGRLMPRAPWKS